jgi:asparagine synthase (glutamine-hydrolysing)
MCGIAGFTHRNQFVTRHTIQKAISLLSHRGPDDQGTHFSPHCSIGAARLKIVDLRAGRQPMYDESGNTVLAFNGEIYNYVELREELERLGHRFISHSDTEVVLHAFLEWDTDSFSRLRGMFAIALWSELEDRLILARDRLGIKPLYICRRRSDIYFASELKAILVHPEIDRRLSMDGLNLFLTMNYVPGKHTLVEGIDKLTPGSWLEWRAEKRFSGNCVWNPGRSGLLRELAANSTASCAGQFGSISLLMFPPASGSVAVWIPLLCSITPQKNPCNRCGPSR